MGRLFSVIRNFSSIYNLFYFYFSFICNPYEHKDSHVTFVKSIDKPYVPFIKCYPL